MTSILFMRSPLWKEFGRKKSSGTFANFLRAFSKIAQKIRNRFFKLAKGGNLFSTELVEGKKSDVAPSKTSSKPNEEEKDNKGRNHSQAALIQYLVRLMRNLNFLPRLRSSNVSPRKKGSHCTQVAGFPCLESLFTLVGHPPHVASPLVGNTSQACSRKG